jgi:2-octaprenyl-6-methoxyphenol hydroxylase
VDGGALMNDQRYDVVIVGGGLVGASLACALAQAWRVAVIESFPLMRAGAPAQYQPSFDARSTALSLSTVRFFEQLGLWQAIRRNAASIRHIHVSDRGRFGSVMLDADEEGLEALGYVVENQWIGNVLHEGLRRCAGLDVFAPASVESVSVHAAGTRVLVRQDGTVSAFDARLLVIADGARSGLAASLGMQTEHKDYEQHALIANIAHRKPHHGRAFERFTNAGPLAMLPLIDTPEGESRSALVWVQPPAEAARVAGLEPQQFLGALQQRFGYRLGRLTRAGSVHVYPLSLLRATEQVRSGVVLLGNAAHSLHPVAGQGFNLSVRDVAALAETLAAARAAGQEPGSLAVLQDFVRRQSFDQERTIGFSDALPRVFGSGLLPLALARDLGLIGMDVFAPARSVLVRHATGLMV